MGSRKAAALSVLVFVCAFAGPQPATAQPSLIAAIHSGTLTVSTSSTRPQMSVGAGAVDVVSVFDDGTFEPERCRPCASGQRVGVGGLHDTCRNLGLQEVLQPIRRRLQRIGYAR